MHTHRWARNLKNVAPKKQNAICKTRAHYSIALLNYLKCIAPQQLMLRTQVFTKKFLSAKNATATLLNKKVLSQKNSKVCRIQTRVF
jgi:hypothetical protein